MDLEIKKHKDIVQISSPYVGISEIFADIHAKENFFFTYFLRKPMLDDI